MQNRGRHSRSRSPERRDGSRDDRYRGRGGEGSSGGRYGDRIRQSHRGGDRRRDDGRVGFGGRGNRRGRQSRGYGYGSRMEGRFDRSKGDYGPLLDRDLDSSYDEKVHRNYANSVFVGNLTYNSTPEDLKEHFGEVGEVVRADIITSRGHHRGMGTVEFTSQDVVEEAIKKFDGSFLFDRQIFVRQDNPPPEESMPKRSLASRSESKVNSEDRLHNSQSKFGGYEVFVANLPFSINWQALKDLFRECGEVIRADVELDRNGYSRGFGTVIIGSKEEMINAIEKFNGYELEGRKLEVREGRANERNDTQNEDNEVNGMEIAEPDHLGESETHEDDSFVTDGVVGGGDKSTLIYCSNLPFSTARSDLFDLFETIGKLKNAELRLDEKGAPTGIAIINYETLESAEVCIDRLNNYNYGGCDLDISYGKRL